MDSRLVARNVSLNLLAQVFPLVVALVALPATVSGLGTERFGILSLAWAVLSYLTLLGVAPARATTKFVAGALSSGQKHEIAGVLSAALVLQGLISAGVALAMVAAIPFAVEHMLKIPPSLTEEAKTTLYLAALCVPVIATSYVWRGALEAAQRFDIVTLVRMPSDSAIFFIPAVSVLFTLSLPSIMIGILAARVLGTMALIASCYRLGLRPSGFGPSLSHVRRIWGFIRWNALDDLINPLFEYGDRFFIGSIVSVEAVSYYTVPYEIMNRMRIIPGVLSTVLLPIFSSLYASHRYVDLQALFVRAIRSLLLLLVIASLYVVLFGRELLQIWIGGKFGSYSGRVLDVLPVAVLVTCIGYLPYALLLAMGRPDLPAKFNIAVGILYFPSAWVVIKHLDIPGAALAYAGRATVGSLLLFAAVCTLCSIGPAKLIADGVGRHGGIAMGLFIASYLTNILGANPPQWLRLGVALTGLILLARGVGALAAAPVLVRQEAAEYWGSDRYGGKSPNG